MDPVSHRVQITVIVVLVFSLKGPPIAQLNNNLSLGGIMPPVYCIGMKAGLAHLD